MPKETLQEVFSALQVRVNDLIFHCGTSAIAETASDRVFVAGAAIALLPTAARVATTVLKCILRGAGCFPCRTKDVEGIRWYGDALNSSGQP
jgi:hypothetical protein